MDTRHRHSRVKLAGILALALLFSAAPLAVAAPGDLDPSFDGDGMVTTDFGLESRAYDMALDSAGHVILAGMVSSGSGPKLGMARFNGDGSLDASFDADGWLVTDQATSYLGPTAGVAVDPLDRIVAGNDNFSYLGRYLPDGSLDIALTLPTSLPTSMLARSVTVDDAGNVVAAGTAFSGSSGDAIVVRWLVDGSLDTGFGGDGVVVTDLYLDDRVYAVALDSIGRVVIAGGAWGQFLVARYNLDGSLDTTFGSGGKRLVEIGVNSRALALAIDGNDRIVLAGYSEVSGADDFAVARLSPDGSLDTTFGGGDGTVTTDFGDEDQAYAVTTDSLDRIIVAGGTDLGYDVAVARYNVVGSLDTTFGGGDGMVTTDFAGGMDRGHAVQLDSSGRILVGGQSCSGGRCHFAVARYLGDDVTPPSHATYLPLVLR